MAALNPVSLVMLGISGAVAAIIGWIIIDQTIAKTGASDPLFPVVKTFLALTAIAIAAAMIFVALRMGA